MFIQPVTFSGGDPFLLDMTCNKDERHLHVQLYVFAFGWGGSARVPEQYLREGEQEKKTVDSWLRMAMRHFQENVHQVSPVRVSARRRCTSDNAIFSNKAKRCQSVHPRSKVWTSHLELHTGEFPSKTSGTLMCPAALQALVPGSV